ncbi:MAG: GNAT family N-acetyltransferase [Solirubrobacterales bacterium]
MPFTSEELREHHDRSRFDSGNADLGRSLGDHALHVRAMQAGRTFVWHAGDGIVVAYFTLAAHLVSKEAVPPPAGGSSPSVIPAILLGRLALDRSEHGRGLGAELLWDALSRAMAANRQGAARLVVVDAADAATASFYRHFGFKPIPGHPHRLIQKLSSIEPALGG